MPPKVLTPDQMNQAKAQTAQKPPAMLTPDQMNQAKGGALSPQPQPQQSLSQKIGGVADTIFGGAKIGEAIGTQIAKGNLGTGLQRFATGRDLSQEEEQQVAPGPTAKQLIGDVGRVASTFIPYGKMASGITSRLAMEGVKRSRGLGGIASGAIGGGFTGASEGIRQGEDLGGVLKSARTGALVGGGITGAGVGAMTGLRKLGAQTGEQRLADLTRNLVPTSRILKEQTRVGANKVSRTPLDVMREEKLLPEVIDSKTDTSKMVQELDNRIEQAANATRETLKGSGLVVPFRDFEENIVSAIRNDETIRNLGQTETALKQLRGILRSYRSSYGREVPVTVIDDIRQTMNQNKWRPEAHDIYRAIGDAARKVVYDAVPDQRIKQMLAREGELIGARKLAESLNARAVKSGLIGKHFQSLVGGLAGAGFGAMGGPLGAGAGAIVGSLAARKAGDIARKAYFKTPLADKARKIVNVIDNADKSPGDRLLRTGMGQRFEANVKDSFRNPSMGLSVRDVSKKGEGAIPENTPNVLRAGQEPVGRVREDVVARERFNIPSLKKVSFGGSDRDVYELGDGTVLKVAKTSRGIDQNSASQDWYAEQQGLIPKTLESGKNYLVKERVAPPDANVKAMVKELGELSNLRSGGFYNNKGFWDEKEQAREILNKYGYNGDSMADFEPLWSDMMVVRNWGTKDGVPILLDEGTLNGNFIKNSPRSPTGRPANLRDPEFRQIYNESRAAKKKFGDTDAKTMYGGGIGGVAGAEEDEEGNRDPMKMGLGLMVGAMVGKKLPPGAFKGLSDLSIKTLEKLKGKTVTSKQEILDLTNASDLKQPERDLLRRMLEKEGLRVNVAQFAEKVKKELLPLATTEPRNISEYRGQSGRYENVALPDDVRGPVANYRENVYESPVKTSAGGVHFSASREGTPGKYFAHSRVEDMSGSTNPKASKMLSGPNQGTRRVIELQSDLFQKGRLESEMKGMVAPARNDLGWANGETYERIIERKNYAEDLLSRSGEPTAGELRKEIGQLDKALALLSDKINSRKGELSKLEPYRNTWHERLIREEVKQAAKDGKTKVQFPTGETAMKIEGLGQQDVWRVPIGTFEGQRGTFLNAENLPSLVGKEIRRDQGEAWIITDVLGDGKFKAIPKAKLESYERIAASDEQKQIYMRNDTEEFDISGKVDTNNPIYRFYEKEVGKYLKNKYGAKLVTDERGVTWWEIDTPKDAGKLPVEAFAAAPLFMMSPEKEK